MHVLMINIYVCMYNVLKLIIIFLEIFFFAPKRSRNIISFSIKITSLNDKNNLISLNSPNMI